MKMNRYYDITGDKRKSWWAPMIPIGTALYFYWGLLVGVTPNLYGWLFVMSFLATTFSYFLSEAAAQRDKCLELLEFKHLTGDISAWQRQVAATGGPGLHLFPGTGKKVINLQQGEHDKDVSSQGEET